MKIIIYNSPSLVEYNPCILENYGIGGLENCVINLSKEFVKRGHSVVCYSDHNKNEIYDNVEYNHISKYNNERVDLFIGVSSFPEKVNSKIKVNWIHRFADFSIEKYKEVDYTIFVSEWHKQYILSHRNVKDVETKCIIINNGISDSFFQNITTKKENKIVYVNHPRKGVEFLSNIYQIIKKEVKDVKCYVFSGTKMWGEESSKYEDIFKNLRNNGINVVGQVGQKRIIEELGSSKIFLYPSTFIETFGLSIVEAMSAGCVPISSYIGNIPDLIKNNENGFLIKGKPNEEKYQKDSAKKAICLLKDNVLYDKMKGNAMDFANKFTWSKATDEFEKLL